MPEELKILSRAILEKEMNGQLCPSTIKELEDMARIIKVEYNNKIINITIEDFEDYESVRLSGATNMLDVKKAVSLSDGLDEEKVKAIIHNYKKLKESFPEVKQ